MRAFFIGDDRVKFLNIAGNDIYIYGEIVDFKIWDEDVTAKEIIEQLKNMKGTVNVHINSPGGDIFSAITIGNILKNYDTVCTIEGICASAATIISSSCKNVNICKNALLMIHDPIVGLCNYFNADELAKVQNSLEKVKQSILTTYQIKTGKSVEELSAIMSAETWYNSDEAVADGFADKVVDDIDVEFENKTLRFKNLSVDCSKFNIGKIERVLNMDMRAQIRNEEIARIKDLNSKRGANQYVNALIDVAIEQGEKYSDIEKYIKAVKDIKTPSSEIKNIITDDLSSGAEGVVGNSAIEDESKLRAKAIADFANRL